MSVEYLEDIEISMYYRYYNIEIMLSSKWRIRESGAH